MRDEADLKHHHELMFMCDAFDLPRGVGVAGHRAYFLKGVGVQLNLALITYGLDFLRKRGYTALQTPFFMNKEVMGNTAQLEQFDEELYKVKDAFEICSSRAMKGCWFGRRGQIFDCNF